MNVCKGADSKGAELNTHPGKSPTSRHFCLKYGTCLQAVIVLSAGFSGAEV